MMCAFLSQNVRRLLPLALAATTITSGVATGAEAAKPKAYFEAQMFSMPLLRVDNKAYSKGWFQSGYSDAEHAFDSNPEAAKQFATYLKNAELSKYILWGTLASSIAFLVVDYNQWHLPRKEHSIVYNTLWIGGVTTGIYKAAQSGLAFNKALNIYNGFESAATGEDSSVNLSFAPVVYSRPRANGSDNGIGVGLSLNF
ncbi:MAG: hypothetical protein FJ146_08465 [Deltaproteobacteria bacterium]|nr:hypothetical protein [Deltaproteobacteria bacterium]